MSTILALDLGLTCGWSYCKDGKFSHGIWQLDQDPASSKKVPLPVRYKNLVAYVDAVHAEITLETIVYEQAYHRPHGGAYAAHQFGAYEALLQIWCYDHDVPLRYFTASELKRWATGSGTASKAMMYEAALTRWGYIPNHWITSRNHLPYPDDNEVDSYCLLRMQLETPGKA